MMSKIASLGKGPAYLARSRLEPPLFKGLLSIALLTAEMVCLASFWDSKTILALNIRELNFGSLHTPPCLRD